MTKQRKTETVEGKHTPGPWTFGAFTVGQRVVIEDPISGHPIAEVINWDPATMVPEEQYYQGHPHYGGGRNECPNARLIAAAPELLAALRAVESDLCIEGNVKEETREMLRAAISRAEAE